MAVGTRVRRARGVAVALAVSVAVVVVVHRAQDGASTATSAAGASATPGVTALPAGRCTVGDRYGGISPDGTLPGASPAEAGHLLDEVVESGATRVRLGAVWSLVEPEPGRTQWASIDATLLAARARGLQVLLLLTYTPAWARPAGTDDKTAPASEAAVAAFGAFARAAATRYVQQGVTAFEIWNEPNVDAFWAPAPDPAGYARLLRAAAAGIRAVIPTATIVTGGLAPAADAADGRQISPLTFVRDLYAEGAQNLFTAVGLHPYAFPVLPKQPGTGSYNAFQRAPRLHEVMAEHGDDAKRIWFTEFGAPTGRAKDAVTDEQQAATVSQGYAALPDWPWAGPLFTYTLRDAGTDPQDREQNFGLRRYDDTPKPAWAAFQRAMSAPGSGCPQHPRPGRR